MKVLVLTLAAISAVSASRAVTCDECQAAVVDLVTRLTSPESIAEQIAILKLTVCPQVSISFDNGLFCEFYLSERGVNSHFIFFFFLKLLILKI